MENEIIQGTPDQISSLILSYGDINLVSAAFESLGWSYSHEITETLYIAKQNKNLAAKLSAIKHLHDLVREAAEASGYLAKVSKTTTAEDGSSTTFSARRIAGALNPTNNKLQKEIVNVQTQRDTTPIVRGSLTGETGGADGVSSPGGDGRSGSDDGGGSAGASLGGGEGGDDAGDDLPGDTGDPNEQSGGPCIDHRPPTCRHALYPGVSSAGSEGREQSEEEV